MTTEQCKYYVTCGAMLCPVDPTSLAHGAWFPTEEICRKNPKPAWIKKQRKINSKLNFCAGCFTHKMLLCDFRVRAGTKGLDPDKGPIPALETAWLSKRGYRNGIGAKKRPSNGAKVGVRKDPEGKYTTGGNRGGNRPFGALFNYAGEVSPYTDNTQSENTGEVWTMF